MPFSSPPQFDPNGDDDALACVGEMRPKLQRVIDQCTRAEGLVCAMTLTYAGLIHQRGGLEEPLSKALAALAELPPVT